jgi:uncharacterized protein (TIGR03382 family)
VGWGNTDDSVADTSGIKRTVDVPFHSTYRDAILSYDPGGGNVCYGDSGGAAFVEDAWGEMRLAGVNSFIFNIDGGTPSCAQAGAAGGAARVDIYLDWIDELVDLEAVEAGTASESEPSEVPEEEIEAESDSGGSSTAGDDDAPDFVDFAQDEAEPVSGGCSTGGVSPGMGLGLLSMLGLARRRR